MARIISRVYNSGFSLIEILTIIAIIGVLSSFLFPQFNEARGKARDSRRLEDIKNIQLALEVYKAENGAYPTKAPGERLWARSDVPEDWDIFTQKMSGLINIPKDPINRGSCYKTCKSNNDDWLPPVLPNDFYYLYMVDSQGRAYDLVAHLENTTKTTCPDGNEPVHAWYEWFDIIAGVGDYDPVGGTWNWCEFASWISIQWGGSGDVDGFLVPRGSLD